MLNNDIPFGWSAVRNGSLLVYPMTGKRFGIGLISIDCAQNFTHFIPLRLDAVVASALFPGMVAAGRVYADLVVSEIER